MDKRSSAETNDPWSLLSRAENWYRIGLLNEAVVASDEAVESGLKEVLNELGVQQPVRREETIRVLEEQGVHFSAQRLLHLKELRERADRVEEDNLTKLEVEEAISVAEDFLSKINDQQVSPGERNINSQPKGIPSRRKEAAFNRYHGGEKEATLLMLSALSSKGPISGSRRDAGQAELELFTKLLLARTILDFKKRRVPHLIGLIIALLSGVVCCLLAAIGGYGVVLMFTGQSFFSIFGLIFDCVLLFISYLFLKITICVKSETR